MSSINEDGVIRLDEVYVRGRKTPWRHVLEDALKQGYKPVLIRPNTVKRMMYAISDIMFTDLVEWSGSEPIFQGNPTQTTNGNQLEDSKHGCPPMYWRYHMEANFLFTAPSIILFEYSKSRHEMEPDRNFSHYIGKYVYICWTESELEEAKQSSPYVYKRLLQSYYREEEIKRFVQPH